LCLCGDSLVAIECGHAFHISCLIDQVNAKWYGARIAFSFLNCALCRSQLVHHELADTMKPYLILKDTIQKMIKQKAEEQPEDLGEFSIEELLDKLAFYECVECKEPYCGGLVSCAENMEIDISNLKCQKCVFMEAPQSNNQDEQKILDRRCFTHGFQHAVFKCDKCCSFATYDCIYNHYCDRCHGLAYSEEFFPCEGLPKCPLGIVHPPNVVSLHAGHQNSVIPYVLGCMKCMGMDNPNADLGATCSGRAAFDVELGELDNVGKKMDLTGITLSLR